MKKFLSILIILQIFTLVTHGQTILPLYKDSIPNSKPAADEEITEYRDGVMIISKISKPTLTVFLPPKNKGNGTGVIICPGGGYWVVAAGHEGIDVAKKFTEMGVAAFVLKYRIPNDAWMINREIGPLQDAQQAIKMVRDNAKKWNINPARIGLMGFSAGGHLAASAGTHFNTCYIPNESNTSVRPDFMMLIYPVISFMPGMSYAGSGEQLLGKSPSLGKLKFYSNELQVTSQSPPAFLVHTSSDEGVKPTNSTVFYDSLISKKVPAEIHIYQTGGHGFGLHIKGSKELWLERCKNWMRINGWLNRKK